MEAAQESAFAVPRKNDITVEFLTFRVETNFEALDHVIPSYVHNHVQVTTVGMLTVWVHSD